MIEQISKKKKKTGNRKSITRVTQKDHRFVSFDGIFLFFEKFLLIVNVCLVYDIKSVTHQNTDRKSCRIYIVDELKIVLSWAHKNGELLIILS